MLVEKLLKEKLDLVFGSRVRKKFKSFVKYSGNFILSLLSYMLFNIKIKDTLTGFHAFSRRNFNLLKWESNRYEFVSELPYLIYKNKLKYGKVSVQTLSSNKLHGMRKRDGVRAILKMFAWRFCLLKFALHNKN
jgi:hypothetical protein